MKRIGTFVLFFWVLMTCFFSESAAQPLAVRLKNAVQSLGADPQMKHATWSLVVADAVTGAILFDHNGQAALAPASTLKVITSITAFELLGIDFRYETRLGYRGRLSDGTLEGDMILQGSGDPSLGSWRYAGTGSEDLLGQMGNAMVARGIRYVHGDIIADTAGWNNEPIPDGWIWQDMGNYYGAGSWKFNWNENQYDVILKSGRQPGSVVEIVSTKPVLAGVTLRSALTAGPDGSGDNAYIYLPPFAREGVIRGTIPPAKESFSISGSLPDPPKQFASQLKEVLAEDKITVAGNIKLNEYPVAAVSGDNFQLLFSHKSPTLDSLVYWFLRKSINLYGESLIRTMGLKQYGNASTKNGVEAVLEFWKNYGIEPGALQLMDGSGLSPQNRITAMALVQSLQYARKRPWFRSFYEGLPVYNGMKLKSGSINGSRAFAGYHTAANGKTYTVAIMVNNYTGSASGMVRKMFLVLDYLK
ncbi:D-alanyl-D-alanine carboxypeptidase/D-alanyl-D-alanine-endopeptidase [Flavihumibacter stibioxidans]|uniref:D-alanyl-D-alanine carboxypeptidase/D-alanyl-D-alanine-endopeptidase n=1 Tax=Flavihumibacter stibioxidans TaxID=1834163 RepID=A0ABR7M4Q3_9BACT|nr:D-alanyl-D-alanine carboxypeptidase/D-alanyl-D-alanine-endopeptidase [Flavihumibacter stibioxidans]MBC6489993.1 D-alanyl-D-alanine carboxypeptidase/D-alanyl-D-alanine-endopeptidase [Flavihumibacter stibioxidans]